MEDNPIILSMKNAIWQTVGLATVASMRSMLAPALLSNSLATHPAPQLGGSYLRFLQQPITPKILAAMAAAEVVGDKKPDAPDRTVPAVISGRALSGALIGAAVFKSQRGSALTGALLGSLTAVATSYVTLAARKYLIKATGQPIVAGLIEDATALASGLAILQGRKGTSLSAEDREANEAARKSFKAAMAHH